MKVCSCSGPPPAFSDRAVSGKLFGCCCGRPNDREGCVWRGCEEMREGATWNASAHDAANTTAQAAEWNLMVELLNSD